MTETHIAPEKYAGENPKALSGRLKWVKGFFYSTAIGDLLMILGSGLLFGVDFSTYDAEMDISSADWFLIGGGLIYTIAFIGSVIVFCMFSFRAMKNLHIWGSRHAEMSPGWTVGWYFIPFANLWKPYQAMTQIWEGTEEVSSSKKFKFPQIGGWWFFWVITNISANVSMRIAMSGSFSESSVKFGAVADIVSGVTGIVAIVLLLPILGGIVEMQDSKIEGEVFN